MLLFAVILSSVLVTAATVQWLIAYLFSIDFNRKKSIRLVLESAPRVAVIMCVRGCDPSLRESLINLLGQDYNNYEIHLVVDSQFDAGWTVAHQVKDQFDKDARLAVVELSNRASTCGLKCSALIQGINSISTDVKYVALTDSDVTTHSTWISDLVGPMEQDSGIGLVMGGQWFEPPAGSTWGALVRSAWNAGALVPTIYFQNPWAGSLAMRLSDVRESGFINVWQRSMVDDGPLKELIQKAGRKIHFAPSLIMINKENCTFGYTNRWVTRMLTWSRLYEPTFFLSGIHAIFSNTVMISLFVVFGLSLWRAEGLTAIVSAIGLVLSGILSVAAYLLSRSVVKRSCDLSNRTLPGMTSIRMIKLFFAVPLTQWVYLTSCLQSCFKKQITWREISYRVGNKNEVQMIAYAPLRQTQKEIDAQISI